MSAVRRTGLGSPERGRDAAGFSGRRLSWTDQAHRLSSDRVVLRGGQVVLITDEDGGSKKAAAAA
eukprot:CAMPEP_0183818604 /NCGR_PEP_ID=MMETSP0803_2-20130417/62539_1 /TAXON_ID=195967 /ORGANISM="Crustomastix stigmata, Strain CCMP3273" /LENGTH=64 /DNA_ID=CAMNT_0026063487 /DNA_START=25 /DNA_END=216 /DNA_ORIENTATION=-